MLTQDDIKILSAPFPKERLGVKVQSFSKSKDKAMLVLYLQHTDVYDRIEQVDPEWTSEVTDERYVGDTCFSRVRMTIKGVSRENSGEGGDPKSAASDALKRAAMLFGVGRYLYDSETVWVDYNEQRDRFKSWSVDEYNRALRPGQHRTPTDSPKPTVVPMDEKRHPRGNRETMNRVLLGLYKPYLSKFPETKFTELLSTRYGVEETKLMTLEQLEDLICMMESKLEEARGA